MMLPCAPSPDSKKRPVAETIDRSTVSVSGAYAAWNGNWTISSWRLRQEPRRDRP